MHKRETFLFKTDPAQKEAGRPRSSSTLGGSDFFRAKILFSASLARSRHAVRSHGLKLITFMDKLKGNVIFNSIREKSCRTNRLVVSRSEHFRVKLRSRVTENFLLSPKILANYPEKPQICRADKITGHK